ncbi:hypothetical protein EJ08DRAFT_696267 [Tothia fuscella]|uniref:Uncharacterized protein n=1 Tax=Tothia fuscella TaxID=1048955 RepID=A0A9P4NTC3_9PEZI|nr:hypothetical protein EJ08DRAFT_696267 [Tothia fuscella]
MLKRKFSSALAPLKIPSRADNRALKAALELSNFDASPVSPPLSPFIDRRPLDSRTEAQLYAACASIVKGYSGDDDQAKLNFSGLHQTKGVQPSQYAPVPVKGRSQSASHLPAIVQPVHVPHSRHASKPDMTYRKPITESRSAHDLVSSHQTVPFPPRTSSATGPVRTTHLDPMPKSPMRPKTAPVDSSEVSYATPKSASTDQHFNYPSTGITSAAITPAHASHRESGRGTKQFVLDNASYQAAISEADNDAAVWMKAEQERRRMAFQSTEAPQPPPTRSSNRGWKSDLADFVRPRISIGSRSASRDRNSHSRKASENVRPGSSQGWRSWGLNRRPSKTSLAEPRVSSDQVERPSGEIQSPLQRKEPDLNRELPPLPSLDTWQEPEPESAPGTHIANLMRKKSKSQRKSSARHTMKTIATIDTHVEMLEASAMPILKPELIKNAKSPDLKLQQSTSPMSASKSIFTDRGQAEDSIRKQSVSHSKTNSGDSCFSPPDTASPGPERSLDSNGIQERFKETKHVTKSTKSLPMSYERRPSDATTAPGTRPMTRDGKAPNFSRKISIDTQGRIYDPHHPNIVQITALPQMPPRRPANFAALRKVLSKLELKDKNKPMLTWMDRFEKDGIKSGVLVQENASPAPFVRY